MSLGKILRLVLAADAAITWSADSWTSTNHVEATAISALKLWYVDLPTKECPGGAVIEFTLFWRKDERWEGKNFSVAVSEG
jgi:glucoamylase